MMSLQKSTRCTLGTAYVSAGKVRAVLGESEIRQRGKNGKTVTIVESQHERKGVFESRPGVERRAVRVLELEHAYGQGKKEGRPD